MRKAIIAGSFDPITVGHQWMIEEGARLFDELLVVIAINPNKKSFFSLEEKQSFIQFFIEEKNLKNVSIATLENEYVAVVARTKGYKYFLRGIRNAQDLEYERTIERMNKLLNEQMTAIYLLPPPEVSEVSSSLVKGLVGPLGWHGLVSRLVNKKVYSAFLEKNAIEKLRPRWLEASLGTEEDFKEVIKKHCESHRFYHNTQHLLSLFRVYDNLNLKHRDVLYASIFFHDLVYDPTAKDNEEQSALAWEKHSQKLSWDISKVQKVTEIIRATSGHAKTNDEVVLQFLDMDLSILGASAEEFYEYEQNIRREYSFVPEDIYRRERARVMKSFKTSYFTPKAIILWNKQRQENLKIY